MITLSFTNINQCDISVTIINRTNIITKRLHDFHSCLKYVTHLVKCKALKIAIIVTFDNNGV